MIKILRHGQSILEVVIATTLISMGVIAALSLTNQSQKSNNYAKALDISTAYNNELADYLRNQKTVLGYAALAEKFSNDSVSGTTTYCLSSLPANSNDLLSLTPGECAETQYVSGTFFIRTISVDTSNVASGIISFSITTSWNDTSERSNTLKLELSRWN